MAWSLHWMVVYQIQSIKCIGFQFNAIETNHLVKESFRLCIQNWDKTLNIFQNISNEILLFLFVSQSKEKKNMKQKNLPSLPMSSLKPWRVTHLEMDGCFCSSIDVVCLKATGKSDMRKPCSVLLMFEPFLRVWLLWFTLSPSQAWIRFSSDALCLSLIQWSMVIIIINK